MQGSYWQGILNRRVTRRHAILGAGTTSAAAAILAACGGSDSSGGSKDSTRLVAPASDTSKQAKRGGVFKEWLDSPIQTFDPHFTSLPNQTPTTMAYQRLVVEKPGYMQRSSGEIVGDLAQSWEFSPDHLTLTMKLRTNDHWSPLAPTNGRQVDAQDVVFSSNRVEAQGTARGNLYASASPLAPIASLTAIDNQTVQIKLSKPLSSTLGLIANSTAGALHIIPKEADRIDLRGTQRGSAFWYLAEYEPSVRLVYKRNPGYHDTDRPYIDSVEMPLISEYSQGLAQLKTGGLYFYLVRPDDILTAKRDAPNLLMQQTDVLSNGIRYFPGFGTTPKAYFKDVRVRQAFALTWDRDLWIDAIYNVSNLEKQGLPVATAYDTAYTSSYYTGWWLDPKGKDFGDNAKYFKRDIAEAKKLLAAAGFPNGITYDSNLVTSGYGPDFTRKVEALVGMGQEAGMNANNVPVNFDTDWRPKYTLSLANFEGIAYIPAGAGADPAEALAINYYPGAQFFMGYDPNGASTRDGDPAITGLIDKMRLEFDTEKRRALVWEFQRYEAKMQYFPRFPGGASSFHLAQPAVRNRLVYQGGTWRNYFEWIDPTKPPLGNS